MPDLTRLLNPRSTAAGATSSVLRGRVVSTPVSAEDSLMVVVDSYSPLDPYEVRPGNWTPRGTEFPAQGDPCLVLFDEFGDAYVPVYAGPYDFGEGAFAFFNG